ncbi:MAG: hypothetical protein AAF497_04240 [Planctomycetota bacterium]
MTEITNPYEAPTSDLSTPTDGALSRQGMVPLWIKIFGWLFIALAVVSIPLMIWGVVTGENVQLELFGFRYIGPALSFYAFGMAMLNMFMGVTAFGLIFRKDWGVVGCLANGYVGLAMCVVSMVVSGGASIRLEPLIQLFYLRRLHKIKPDWDTASP